MSAPLYFSFAVFRIPVITCAIARETNQGVVVLRMLACCLYLRLDPAVPSTSALRPRSSQFTSSALPDSLSRIWTLREDPCQPLTSVPFFYPSRALRSGEEHAIAVPATAAAALGGSAAAPPAAPAGAPQHSSSSGRMKTFLRVRRVGAAAGPHSLKVDSSTRVTITKPATKTRNPVSETFESENVMDETVGQVRRARHRFISVVQESMPHKVQRCGWFVCAPCGPFILVVVVVVVNAVHYS